MPIIITPTEGIRISDNAQRISRAEIVDRSLATIARNREIEPRFPKAREAFAGIVMASSFSHANLSPWSSQLVGNVILREISAELGIRDGSILNLVHDNGKPQCDPAPGGHRIDLGNFPRIFDGGKPYSSPRQSFKEISFGEIEAVTAASFPEKSRETVRDRLSDILGILVKYQKSLDIRIGPTSAKEIANLPHAILQSRQQVFEMLGIENVRETLVTSIATSLIPDVLEVLEFEYGKPFYKMELSESYIDSRGAMAPGFRGAGYLKGIDMNGVRRPVEINFVRRNGTEVPVFTFIGESTTGSRKNSVTVPDLFRAEGREIYDAMRSGRVVPTVPTMMLATTTAVQIPHMGSFNWKDYAPAELRRQARFLGMGDEEAKALYLCTEGNDSFVVKRDGQEIAGTFPGYVTLGKEGIRESISKDMRIEIEWGKLLRC